MLRVYIKDQGYKIGLAAVVVFAAFALSYGITLPWSKGHEGFNGAVYSGYARNFIQYGLLPTKLGHVTGQVISLTPATPENFSFYANHPTLLALIVAFFFRVFGESEWAARLVPILFSVASIPLVFLIGRQLWNKRVGLLAAVVFAVNPMFLHYGHMVNFEPLVMFFMLLAIISYLRWVEGDRRYLVALCASLFLGGITDWPIYYLIPILGLHYLVFIKRKDLLAVLPALTGVASLGLLFLQLRWFGQVYFKNLIDSFFFRSNLKADQDPNTAIALFVLMDKMLSWGAFFFTTPLLVTGFAGPLIAIYVAKGKQELSSASLLLGFFAIATIHVILFKQAAMIHSYWMYYFLLPLALSAGITVDFAASRLPKRFSLIPAVAILLLITPLALLQVKELYTHSIYTQSLLGKALASASAPGDVVLSSAPALSFSEWPQIVYYARRNIYGPYNSVADFKKALEDHPSSTIMVTIVNRTDPDLQNHLFKVYQWKKVTPDIIFFKLKAPQ